MAVRILQVGAGIRGKHWAGFVDDHPDFTCVGFVDPDAAALEALRERFPAEGKVFLRDLDEALASTEADAALIVSPSALHADHSCQALEAGLTVMVEKPLATSIEEAERVLATARGTGRTVMVAENYRYWPSERTVRQLVAEGRIGRIDSATLVDRRHMPSHTEGPWLARIEYPQLQEIAVHHFDSLRAFFSRAPSSLSAHVWNPAWSDYSHGAVSQVHLDLEGVRVEYLGTLSSHRFSFDLRVEGEGGSIWTNRKYVAWRPAGSRFFRPVRRVDVPPGDEASYPKGGTTSLLNALRDAVVDGTEPETSGSDNIWNVAMIEAAKRSDREGRTVSIEEVWPGAPSHVEAGRTPATPGS